MANDLTKNPYIVDTAATITATPSPKRKVRIVGVRWVGPTTDTHTAVITDGADRVVWASKCVTATIGLTQESHIPFECVGLKVSTIASGTLYIYQDPES